jgi:hypothetical protein
MRNKHDELRKQHEKFLKELEEMGEFRRGSINVFYRRCGKPRCVCNQEGHPGHGPQTTLTLKEKGKTLARNLPISAAVRVVAEQIGNHNEFKEWGKKWLKLNEEMADLRLGNVLIRGEDEEPDQREKKLRRPSSRRSKRKLKA